MEIEVMQHREISPTVIKVIGAGGGGSNAVNRMMECGLANVDFVAFTDHPEPGHYWGQVAIICYDSNLDQAFKPFIATTAQRLSDGVRPEIDLGEQGVEQVISSNGNWTPKQTVAFPPKEAGTVIMKSRRKMSEKLIEQGRKGNKGCYAVSWLFLLALVALALFSLKSCGAF